MNSSRSKGLLDLLKRAFAGETIEVPPHWYDPRELRQVHAEGRRVGIQVSLFPLRNLHGAIEHVALCFKDVTTELERQRERDQLRALLDAALDGIVGMDGHGNVTEFNRAAERMFGHSRASGLGRPLADVLVPVRLRAEHRAGLARHLAHGGGPILGKQIELPALRADGTEFPAELAVVEVPSRDGPSFTGYIRDLTERKRAAEELEMRQQTIIALSTPVLRPMDGVLLLPLIGLIDAQRAGQLTRTVLDEIGRSHDRVVLIDLTGVPEVDEHAAHALVALARAAALMGATPVLAGLTSSVAAQFTGRAEQLGDLHVVADLMDGLELAVSRTRRVMSRAQ
jgi:PAS domain S-box-containing protein